jgi:beta-mannosidase
MNTIQLTDNWEVRKDFLLGGPEGPSCHAGPEDGWLPAAVPGDIHEAMVASGAFGDPVTGLNSFDSDWTKTNSWWYRRRFVPPKEWDVADVVELSLAGLDSEAAIYLNGQCLGHHRNAFRPFVTDIKPWFCAGQENTLLIRLSAGVERISEADVHAGDGFLASTPGRDKPERGENRRVRVRKPQYVFGWDWAPCVPTTGIAFTPVVRALRKACLRDVTIVPEVAADGRVRLRMAIEVEALDPLCSTRGTVSVRLVDVQGREVGVKTDTFLRSGINHVDLAADLEAPQWWWPHGMGEPHLYTVDVQLKGEGWSDNLRRHWGLRTVELDTKEGFRFIVNGQPVYAKGGNWVPADSLYARVTPAKIEHLVAEAKAANFNMLRVWGGGLYEQDAFYDACDRQGIMVWQDFMFACATYPDNDDGFVREVELEADYQTRRLRAHPCVVLWCGSNENTQALHSWWQKLSLRGTKLYNHTLPTAVRRNCPELPYWNGSPYGGEDPNGYEEGDVHEWRWKLDQPLDAQIRLENYDTSRAKFLSEYGVTGPCVVESVREYLAGVPEEKLTEARRHHTNAFEDGFTGAMIAKRYGQDAQALSLEEYCRLGGLGHGHAYEYVLDSGRFRAECWGTLFWMYNDCWGEEGWSIVDYYLRRKPAWYFVRRAFAPRRLLARWQDGIVRVVLANDARTPFNGAIRVGRLAEDGSVAEERLVAVEVAPMSRAEVFSRADAPFTGIWFACSADDELDDGELDPAVLYASEPKALRGDAPAIQCTVEPTTERSTRVRVSSDGFAHAVEILLPEGHVASDQFFDLLPGRSRSVEVTPPLPDGVTTLRVRCEEVG